MSEITVQTLAPYIDGQLLVSDSSGTGCSYRGTIVGFKAESDPGNTITVFFSWVAEKIDWLSPEEWSPCDSKNMDIEFAGAECHKLEQGRLKITLAKDNEVATFFMKGDPDNLSPVRTFYEEMLAKAKHTD